MGQIEYRTGCVVTAFKNGEFDVFAHGANCQKTMGSGVARVVRDKLPILKQVDDETDDNIPGWISGITSVERSELKFQPQPERESIAINLYTQEFYGTDRRQFNYGAYSQAFILMSMFSLQFLTDENVPKPWTLGIPKIGAGLGGGDWEIIEEITSSLAFGKLGAFDKVYVYTL